MMNGHRCIREQDKVGRIIIDGVVDSEDYYAGEVRGEEASKWRLISHV